MVAEELQNFQILFMLVDLENKTIINIAALLCAYNIRLNLFLLKFNYCKAIPTIGK